MTNQVPLNKFYNKPNSFRCCEIKKFEKDKEINDLKLKDLKTKIQTIMNQFNKADINLYGRYIRSYIMVRLTFCCCLLQNFLTSQLILINKVQKS
jgi:hypothetical protein